MHVEIVKRNHNPKVNKRLGVVDGVLFEIKKFNGSCQICLNWLCCLKDPLGIEVQFFNRSRFCQQLFVLCILGHVLKLLFQRFDVSLLLLGHSSVEPNWSLPSQHSSLPFNVYIDLLDHLWNHLVLFDVHHQIWVVSTHHRQSCQTFLEQPASQKKVSFKSSSWTELQFHRRFFIVVLIVCEKIILVFFNFLF